MPRMDRRSLLKAAGAYAVQRGLIRGIRAQSQIANSATLKAIGQRSGRRIGVFTVASVLQYTPAAVSLIEREFSMIADVNDLKFSDRLRPTPDTFDFTKGDYAVEWARERNIAIRGHCLVWWNALPNWFQSYVTSSNAEQVMTSHISTVVRHYAGQMYSWDVVNEPIYNDHRPDGLRIRPWLQYLGPEYIDLAFHTAAASDPKARLLVNECYIEHDTPAEIERRGALLALLKRLRNKNVPITALGIQGHLRGNTPIDKPGMLTFVKQVKDIGLDVLVTELDVDDIDVPGSMIDEVVSRKYGEFIDLVGPYASSISFQWLTDDPNQRRSDGQMHRPDLFDPNYQPKPAYSVVAQALERLPHFSVEKSRGDGFRG